MTYSQVTSPFSGRDLRLDLQRAKSRYYLGVDLGQAQSHTALAIVQRAELVYRHERDPVTQSFRTETRFFLRYAERLPLGTSYPAVAEYVRKMVQREPVRGSVQVIVDATGVGVPVVDLLRKDGPLGCPLVPVTITGGDWGSAAEVLTPAGTGYRVPKLDLIMGLQVAFERSSLEIAKGLGRVWTLCWKSWVRCGRCGARRPGMCGCGERGRMIWCWRFR